MAEVVKRRVSPAVLAAGLLMAIIITGYFHLIAYPMSGEFIVNVLVYANIPGVNRNDRRFIRNETDWIISIGFFMTVNLLWAYLMKRLGKRAISPEVIVLTTMISASLAINCAHGPNEGYWQNWGYNVFGCSLYWYEADPEIWALLPPLVDVNDPSVWEAILPVSTWSIHPAFYLPIAWNILHYTSQTLLFVLLAMLLKMIWFDVENIPAIYVEIQTQAIQLVASSSSTSESEKGKSVSLRWFLIGFLIQGVYMLLAHTYGVIAACMDPTVSQTFRDYNGYLWNTGIQIAPVYDFTLNALLPWVPLCVSFLPYQLGFGYLLPLDVSISCVLGYAIFMALIPIAFTYLGIFPSFSLGTIVTDAYKRMVYEKYTDGEWFRGLYTWLPLGMMVAIALYPFLRYRERTKRLIRTIYSVDEELENLSPLPLRLIWMGIIVSAIIWFSTWIAIGAAPQVTFVSLLINSLVVIASTRVILYTGGAHCLNGIVGSGTYMARGPWAAPGSFALYYLAPTPTPTSSSWATSMVGEGRIFRFWVDRQVHNSTFALYSLKIGENLKVRRRDMAIALLLTFALVMISRTPFYVLRYHIWPWTPGSPLGTLAHSGIYKKMFVGVYKSANAGDWPSEIMKSCYRDLFELDHAAANIVLYFTVGVLAVVGMQFLRERYPRVRLLPEGILVGIFMGNSYVIPAILLGAILKMVTFQAGLIKTYREKFAPLCWGLVLGYFIPAAILSFLILFYSFPVNWLWRLSQLG